MLAAQAPLEVGNTRYSAREVQFRTPVALILRLGTGLELYSIKCLLDAVRVHAL